MRVVSLVPSLSEFVEFLTPGSLCGVTRFCVQPAGLLKRTAVIGGTKNPDIARIAALKPDLVLANREENRREDVEALTALGIPVLVTVIQTVDEALAELVRIGEALGAREKAVAFAAETAAAAAPVVPGRLRALYLIWRNPWMAAGGDTFISDMMHRIGLDNVLAGQRRYPVLSPEELMKLEPQLVLLPDEPYAFRPVHVRELSALMPGSRVEQVDGQYFSWYGSRMLPAFRALAAWRQTAG